MKGVPMPYLCWSNRHRLAVYRAPTCCGSTTGKQLWVWILHLVFSIFWGWGHINVSTISPWAERCFAKTLIEFIFLISFYVFEFQMADPGRYLQCVRTLRDYAGKGCWEAQVCVIKSSKLPINTAVDLMCVVVHFQSRDDLICQSAAFYFPNHIL